MMPQQTMTVNKKAEVPVSGAEEKIVFNDIHSVLSDVVEIGNLAIRRVANKEGVDPRLRRSTIDVDVYSQEKIDFRKLQALRDRGIKPHAYAAGEIGDRFGEGILFLRIKVNNRYIPVDIFQFNIFDKKVTEKGYNMRITNTQDVIMKGAQEVDGVVVPSMAFEVILKAQAHIERYIRFRDREDPLKTDKHGRDISLILRYLLKQTPEEFMKANDDLIKHMLGRDRESEETLLKVLREIYYGNDRKGYLRN